MSAADELYGLPLDRFVAERSVLARALRAAGDRDAATDVSRLGKPTVAAWAVNQLVRTRAAAVRRLFDAGDALKQAQHELVEGRGGGAELRGAAAAKRGALQELVDGARGLLDAGGHGLSEATLTRVSETLDAAALDRDARERVQAGCLTRELRHAGLGDAGSFTLTPPAGSADAPPRAAPAAREQEALVARARANAARARDAFEHAGQQLAAAEERRERAASALAAADRALAGAREDVERARALLDGARAELDGAGDPPGHP